MGPGIAVAFAVGGCRALVIGRGAAQLRRAEEAFQAALAARTYLQDRFLFASGYPFAPVGGALEAYRAMGFTDRVAEKIFWRNAAALLRLGVA
jgi:predicted TIM-barrel fold metal-dependent hydrolase